MILLAASFTPRPPYISSRPGIRSQIISKFSIIIWAACWLLSCHINTKILLLSQRYFNDTSIYYSSRSQIFYCLWPLEHTRRPEERIAEGILWIFTVDKITKCGETLISFCRTSSDSLITLALDQVSINIEQKGGL